MEALRERPILFDGEMVRAILAGRKTQTRRIVIPIRFRPGDRLWVRETFREFNDGDTFYRADWWTPHGYAIPVHADDDPWAWRWQPSIHMPRRLSRIMLEIMDVRVQRLQDITEEDAKAEGIELPERTVTHYDGQYRDAFAALWDRLNAKRGYGWDTNCWVWRIEFGRAI